MRTIALDLGAKKICFCELAHGAVIQRGTVTSITALEPLLGPQQPPARVAIEACREAWHIHDVLTDWGNDVLLVDTTRSKQIGIGNHGRKTDRIDAEALARALKEGRLPAAHLLSPERREFRDLLGVRRALVETHSCYIATTRGLLRELGCALHSCTSAVFVKTAREAKLEDKVQLLIAPLLIVMEALEPQIAEVEERLIKLCTKEPATNHLMTIPGIGPIVAAAFISVIDDAHRFHSAHQVASYLGLVPSENSSGTKRRLGSISKKGNSYMRALLTQSAWVILKKAHKDDPLRKWGEALTKRRGKRVAAIALARRLSGVLWAIWRDGTVYDPAFAARSGARGLRAAAQDIQFRATEMERASQKLRRYGHKPPKTPKGPTGKNPRGTNFPAKPAKARVATVAEKH